MSKLKSLIIVILLAAISCNNQEQKTKSIDNKPQVNPLQEINKLNDFLTRFDEPSQIFKASTDKPIKVIGKQGTIIHLNPADLVTESGKPLGKEVEVELKELTNSEQLMRANAQTVSDSNILFSGGAYYIKVTSDGENIKVKDGKTYTAQFPTHSKDEMKLYYGQRDSTGRMNWKGTDTKFNVQQPVAYKDTTPEVEAIIVHGLYRKDTTILKGNAKDISEEEYQKTVQNLKDANDNRDRMIEEAKVKDRVYYPVELKQFGYINCDKLLLSEAHKTSIHITTSNKIEEANFVKVSMIFKDLNSQIQTYYFNGNDAFFNNAFTKIPVGMTVRFFAVCYQNGKLYAILTDEMQTIENLNVNLLLKEMTEDQYNDLLKELH
jgi:hypothetical protein